jgi:hypothetical protein
MSSNFANKVITLNSYELYRSSSCESSAEEEVAECLDVQFDVHYVQGKLITQIVQYE